jgi:phosphonate transport system substrate-binding protein
MRKVILLFLIIFPLFTGCTTPQAEAYVDLNKLEPLPQAAAADVKPLRVAVAAILSPTGSLDNYQPMLDYLSKKLDRPVEMVQRRTYAEINELVKTGEVDVAFVCTSAYIVGEREFGMELLAAPQVKGETVYYSILIVPAYSKAESMADLRGKVFAFTDPMSNTGRNYPVYLVHQLGEEPESFFSRTFYTYSHDDAIRAVASGIADGAAVDSLVYAYAVEKDPSLAEQVRIIHRSEPFGMPPVVTGPNVRPQTKALLLNILQEMDNDPEGQKALAVAGFDRFLVLDDSVYDSARELETLVNVGR